MKSKNKKYAVDAPPSLDMDAAIKSAKNRIFNNFDLTPDEKRAHLDRLNMAYGNHPNNAEFTRPDDSMMHDLKCWPEYFSDVESGIKTFELRVNDRNYRIGDLLFLREFCPEKQEYTGKKIMRFVSYVFPLSAIPPGSVRIKPSVIMAIVPFEHQEPSAV